LRFILFFAANRREPPRRRGKIQRRPSHCQLHQLSETINQINKFCGSFYFSPRTVANRRAAAVKSDEDPPTATSTNFPKQYIKSINFAVQFIFRREPPRTAAPPR
jgi:hypothetical protein